MIKAGDVCVSCDDWVVVRQDHGGQPAARLHKLERRGVLRYLTRKNNSARLIMKVPYQNSVTYIYVYCGAFAVICKGNDSFSHILYLI